MENAVNSKQTTARKPVDSIRQVTPAVMKPATPNPLEHRKEIRSIENKPIAFVEIERLRSYKASNATLATATDMTVASISVPSGFRFIVLHTAAGINGVHSQWTLERDGVSILNWIKETYSSSSFQIALTGGSTFTVKVQQNTGSAQAVYASVVGYFERVG